MRVYMKKQGDGFSSYRAFSRNRHICMSRILNLCKNMKILAILTRIMKTQAPQRNDNTYHVTRFLSFPTVHHTLVDLDGSCSSRSRICLNDMILVGPTVQEYLFSIFLRFRREQIAFTSDIAKMCRKVRIRQDNRNLQRRLW